MTRNVIILGTGPAGYTAAIYCARARLEPLVVEGPQPGGQLTTTTEVENFPGFAEGIDGFTLVNTMREQAARFGTDYVTGRVVKADLSVRPLQLELDSGEKLEAHSLIIATGASARYLGLESEQALISKGVSGCATCDGAFYRDVPVAVVGGGDSAVEEALFLTRFASKVYMVHRRDELRASKIMAERAMKHEKIEILWNSTVVEVKDPAQNKVTAIVLKDTQTGALRELPLEGLFLGIGHQPNAEAFEGQLDKDDLGYLVTDQTRTNVPGVFAAGDVQDSQYRQAVTAAGSGCKAALEVERYLETLGH